MGECKSPQLYYKSANAKIYRLLSKVPWDNIVIWCNTNKIKLYLKGFGDSHNPGLHNAHVTAALRICSVSSGPASWSFCWLTTVFPWIKAQLYTQIMPHYGMKPCIFLSSIKTLLKQWNGSVNRKSSFTLKRVQEVWQIFMFVSYATDEHLNCGER